MLTIYSIIQREHDLSTGDAVVKLHARGTYDMVSKKLVNLKMRSQLNQGLTYYVCLFKDEQSVIEMLKKDTIRKSKMYTKL